MRPNIVPPVYLAELEVMRLQGSSNFDWFQLHGLLGVQAVSSRPDIVPSVYLRSIQTQSVKV